MICHSEMGYFFSKEYTQEPYKTMMKDIGKVDYYRCVHCGFVFSKTHYELSEERWKKLNFDFHYFAEKFYAEKCNTIDLHNKFTSHQPPYLQTAIMIAILAKNNIICTTNMLDYAGGYGTLSKILLKYFSIDLLVYDPYVQNNDTNYTLCNEAMKFNTVVNSAMFEHILNRYDIDKINNLIIGDGCLILHTVVCERIPKDSDWFYMDPPVHCAFHTNMSMNILMNQWNYCSSIYCPISKCWVLLKKDPENIYEKLKMINKEMQETYFYYKKGFVDYWKGF